MSPLTVILGCLLLAVSPLPLGAAPPAPAVFPSAPSLPANHLKFYLHFPEPMAAGQALAHLALIDLSTGQPVPEPFRETELWDDSHRRLTLWLHPGRQKTGVNLNSDLGPVLSEGRRYDLRLLPGWRAASGAALPPATLKTFRVGPRQTAQLDPASWNASPPPPPGTRQPWTLAFPLPLDHALLGRCLRLHDSPSDSPLPGSSQIGPGELSWTFTPDQPWPDPGTLELRVLSLLEDLAGNSLARPFEVDLAAPPPLQRPPELRLPLNSLTPRASAAR